MGWLFGIVFTASILMLASGSDVPVWMWFVDLALGVMWMASIGSKEKQNSRVGVSDKYLFDKGMTYSNGHEYERYVAYRLEEKFKDVEITPKSGDYGADILCYDEDHGVRLAIQCKYYNKPVGYKAIEEAVSGMHYYGCDVAVVITNSTFTKQARQAAERMGVLLTDNFK